MTAALPISRILNAVQRSLSKTPRLIITAAPGSGKSTILPLHLSDSASKIVVVQPRRVAARSLATYVATLKHEPVGHSIGYSVRYDSAKSTSTRIEYITDGLLVQRILKDPELADTDMIILDEFHERSVYLDFALALLYEVQEVLRPELKLVIMSATLNTDELVAWFDAPHIHASGTPHANEINFTNTPIAQNEVVSATAKIIQRVTVQSECQNTLVFLPGEREIRQLTQLLNNRVDLPIHALYGRQSLAEQTKVLNFQHRQIVLATNLAETSITLPRVNRVIDSGWRRASRYVNAWASQALFTTRITDFSARQRAGRANRTQPGVVERLWTKHQHESLSKMDPPSITQTNLERLYLQCLAWGTAPQRLTWLTTPPQERLLHAERQLKRLGAIAQGRLTKLARYWHLAPLNPRSMAILERSRGLEPEEQRRVVLLLPLLDGEPLPGKTEHTLVDRLSKLPRHHGYTKTVDRLSQRLGLPSWSGPPPNPLLSAATLPIFLAAYPERLAQRRRLNHRAYLMSNGIGGELRGGAHETPPPYCLALSVGGHKASTLTIFDWLTIDEEWISSTPTEQLYFSPQDKKVICREVRAFERIILSSKPMPLPNKPAAIAACMAEAIYDGNTFEMFDHTDAFKQLAHRVAYFNHTFPSEALPQPIGAPNTTPNIDSLIAMCHGYSSYASLKRIDLVRYYLDSLNYGMRTRFEMMAPCIIALENGHRAKLRYDVKDGPILSSRFEWLFGIEKTPTLNGEPILLELLAPNLRPVQRTRDLKSFWQTGYGDVKRTLRGRYPKHPWPDDPCKAEPGLGRRKKHSS